MDKIKVAKNLLKVAKKLEARTRYTLTDETMHIDGHLLHRIQYADGKIGGWIESEDNLQGNAKVLDDAMVYGDAVVSGNACIYGKSSIYGDTQVYDYAVVQDNAKICDNSKVYRYAVVKDNAKVCDKSRVYGDAVVSGNACIYGKSSIYGDATVSKMAKVRNSEVSDQAIVTDNAILKYSTVEGNTKIFGQAKVEESDIHEFAEISGTVKSSIIWGKSVIEGTLLHSDIEDRIVKKGETVESEDDLIK